MNGLNRMRLLGLLAAWLGGIRTRTWLILGAAGFVLLGLVVWAGIALLSWLWAQAPVAADAGKRLGSEAATRIEQTAPGLGNRLDQWVPGLRAALEPWLPGFAAAPPQDVSGVDIGPVPRYPSLVRNHFAREAGGVEVAYTGSAAPNAVLAHYVKGFAAAGFAHDVIAATADGERHRFRRAQESFDLALARGAGGLIEVRLQQPARSSPREFAR